MCACFQKKRCIVCEIIETMSLLRRLNPDKLVLIVLCLAAFLVNNSLLPVDGGEAKLLVTARDIVDEGNWIAPTMNGELRLDKPPLASWVAALVEQVHSNISAQRTVSGVLAIFMTMCFFALSRYVSRQRGFAEMASVVFITTYNIIYMGRLVERNIYGYAFMMGGIYFLLRMLFDNQFYTNPHKWRWALLGGLCMALSLLGNGFVAVFSMLLPCMIALGIFRRPDMTGRWLPLLFLVVLALLPYGWWLAYLHAYYPGQLSEQLGILPISGSSRPWYYYWRFFAEMGIWTVFVLASLCFPYWRKRIRTRRVYRFTMVWLVAALVILTLMPRKDMTNLVALTPPCALAVTCVLYYFVGKWPTERIARRFFYFNGYLIAFIVFGLPVFMLIRMFGRDLIDFGTMIFLWVFFWGISAYTAMSTSRHDAKGIVRGVALLFFFVECFLLSPIVGVVGNSHKTSISLVNKVPETGNLTFYHDQDEELRMEVVYDLGRKVLPLDLNDLMAVRKATPFALLTQKPLAEVLPKEILSQVDTIRIGVFDNNELPRHNSHYNPQLINQVSIIKSKHVAK